MQVIRWYLCSFHAGRKSGVAKKPYNPILGENFRCHWNIPNTNSSDNITDSGSKLISDGPVPWCKENQLAFLAEQVSHHPPGIKVIINSHFSLTSNIMSHDLSIDCTFWSQLVHFMLNTLEKKLVLELMFGQKANFWA